jgi:hypothetical protein
MATWRSGCWRTGSWRIGSWRGMLVAVVTDYFGRRVAAKLPAYLRAYGGGSMFRRSK